MPMPHRTHMQRIQRRLVGKEGSERVRELRAILNELPGYLNGPYGASQGDGARSAWTPKENVSAVCLGHRPVAECGVATDGRRDCAAWDQRGEDAQHRTPLCALRRKLASSGEQDLKAISHAGAGVLERKTGAVGAGLYAL